MSAKQFLLIIIIGIAMILAAGCTQPAVQHQKAQETPLVTVTVQVPPLTGTDAAVSRKLDAYMTALTDAGRFSGTVLVARGDTVILSKGYGMANYEFSIPNTPGTVFPVGSNTKQLTAAAIMKLQEQGTAECHRPGHVVYPQCHEMEGHPDLSPAEPYRGDPV